jgi:hypothetical protein
MISFKSKDIAIREADRITRYAHSIYPHVSESRMGNLLDKHIAKNSGNEKICSKLCTTKYKNAMRIDNLRARGGYGIEQFYYIIDMLKNKAFANCYENAVFAQLLGKINGIKNIYPSKMFFTQNSSGRAMDLYHAVAVITDKPFEKDFKYQFKNKDAIIVDSWLGITEYAGEYLNRLRNQFFKSFPNLLSSNEITEKNVAFNSNSVSEYNQKIKKCFKHEFYFKLHDDEVVTDEQVEIIKKDFPELILK